MSIRKRVRTKARKALGVNQTVGKILQALTAMSEHMEAQDELLEVLVESNESLRAEIDGLKKFSSCMLAECMATIPNFKGLSESDRQRAVVALLSARSQNAEPAENEMRRS
jgi:hypothetical protein